MSETPLWAQVGDAVPVLPADLRLDRAHSARVYDYMLGGKDNFAADREVGDELLTVWPEARTAALAARGCMRRIARRLVDVHGVGQFLDIGSGLPTSPNLHEVAQDRDPAARIVYVDNDPIVLSHARALLTSTPQGRVAYIDADLRDVDGILTHPILRETLDLTRPVALTLINILHFFPDTQAYPVVKRLVSALSPGSFLALCVGTADSAPQQVAHAARCYQEAGIENHQRTRAEVERFFTGLELDEPGVSLINQWHPDEGPAYEDHQVIAYAGLARKA